MNCCFLISTSGALVKGSKHEAIIVISLKGVISMKSV